MTDYSDLNDLTGAERDLRIGALSLAVSVRRWNEDSWRNATYAPTDLYSVSPDDLVNAHDLFQLLLDRTKEELFEKRGVAEHLGKDIAPSMTDEEFSKWKSQLDRSFSIESKVSWLRIELTDRAVQKASEEVASLMSLSGHTKFFSIVEDIVCAGRLVRVIRDWNNKDSDEQLREQQQNEVIRVILEKVIKEHQNKKEQK